MSDQTDKLLSLLQPFGLDAGEASVYLELLGNGTLTALKISRNIHMGRTKVYRILDKLSQLQLVSHQYDDVGFKFTANAPTQLELVLSQREGELQGLRNSLPSVISSLERHMGTSQPGSKTLYYRGHSGLSQVNYNLLRAHGVFYSYEVDTAEAYLDHDEAEQLRKELVENRIKAVSISNKTYFSAFTDITNFVPDFCEIRYIDPAIFKIKADVFIYNDVYAICNYVEHSDVFCLEVYNQSLADMQRQSFQNLWQQAKPLTIMNEHGEAKLI